MRRREISPEVLWGGLIIAAVYGIVCAGLILAGVLSATLWFTVAAMVLLSSSFGIQLVSQRRRHDGD